MPSARKHGPGRNREWSARGALRRRRDALARVSGGSPAPGIAHAPAFFGARSSRGEGWTTAYPGRKEYGRWSIGTFGIRDKSGARTGAIGASRDDESVSHVLAAVDVDLGAVHVGRRLGAQHVDDLGHLVGRAEPLQRNLLDDLLGAGRQDRGVDLARRDGVDADAEPAEVGSPSRASAKRAPPSRWHRPRRRTDARASRRSR